MKKSAAMKKRLLKILGVPETLSKKTVEITVLDNRQLTVWSHMGVLCAEEELVSLHCGAFVLKIEGSGLKLDAVNKSGTLVSGVIKSISF